MGLFGLFKKSKEEKLNYIRILYELANIDNSFTLDEIETISYQALKLKLKKSDVLKLRYENNNEFIVPKDETKKRELLSDMVFLMMIDKFLDEREYAFCIKIMKKLGFPKVMLDNLIEKYINMFTQSREIDPIISLLLRSQHEILKEKIYNQ